ncbi:translational activator of cytochrome c oxidase 1 [Megachile rotundata]|uniref:translational activator of cytochrome c oxidase 1 n=1 Tax=Megachile rotundata TaxID=143995 RepID=UPI003FD0618C
MKYRLNNLIYCLHTNFVINGTRRYAGHSKWHNIKHIKEENDRTRGQLFKTLISKMTVAVREEGSADPLLNSKLANLIDQAKKVNMPLSTINTFLNKMKTPKAQAPTKIMPIRTSSGCTLLLHYATNNPGGFKALLNNILRKSKSTLADTALSMFDCGTYILAVKDCNFNQAMEDAIEAGAEDVEELKENDKTYFKFKCEFLFPDKVQNQLTRLGYFVLLTEDTCIPNSVVELSEEQLEMVNKLKSKLLELDDIIKIEDNIAES